MQVTKRDGRVVPFDKSKIVQAIEAAMKETKVGIEPAVSNRIADIIEAKRQNTTVESIQDQVERLLMQSAHKDAAKKFILYRANRTKQRELQGAILDQVRAKTNGAKIDNANANVDEHTYGGRKNEAACVIQKQLALEENMSQDVAFAHKDGLIYQHDLDHFNLGAHNCLQLDFQHLFKNGFATRNCDVRPPSVFSTACQQVAVALQLQSQCQYGGCGSIHIDTDLAPFVKKSFFRHYRDGVEWIEGKELDYSFHEDLSIDEPDYKVYSPKAYDYAMTMLEREGKQAAEALWHNLGTLESRAGSQVPFSSLNYGRDSSPEGRLVTKWFLNASINGVGKHHKTSIFPISIFSYKKGVNANKEDPNYDLKQLAIKSLSQRIYPNICNGDWSEAHEDPNDPDTIFSTMGCRTMIGYDRHGCGYKRVGRGNNTPITIILPKLGIDYGICLGERTEPDLDGFWKKFEETLLLMEKAHLERFAIMMKQSPKAAPFMYQNGTIVDADKCENDVYEALKHNTFAFGFIGIAEMCEALFGVNHVKSNDAYSFAYKVVKRINEFAKEFSERNNLNGSCYATPAENLCLTAMKKLQSQYGRIENVTSRDYLTNSFHVPVWEKVSIYEKLQLEAPFTKLCTGGTITYIECEASMMKNPKAIEDIIDYAMQELDIPYLAFNFPIDSCDDCGYTSEFDNECPECGSKNITQLRRVTGYLSSDYRRFNDGKQAEVKDRVKHSKYTYIKTDKEEPCSTSQESTTTA